MHSIDLNFSRACVDLQFKDADGNVIAILQLQLKPLRHWLNILFDQYRKAQWPTSVWPAWVAESKPSITPARTAVLH